MAVYRPGTGETDPYKINLSLQAIGAALDSNLTNAKASATLAVGASPLPTAAIMSVSGNTASLPTISFAGETWMVRIAGADGTAPVTSVEAYGSFAATAFQRANGTAASPTNLLSGQLIGAVTSHAYGATGYFGGAGQLRFVATQDWTDTAQGTDVEIWGVPNGGTCASNVSRVAAFVAGTGVTVTGSILTNSTAGIGYSAGFGAGGTIAQSTNKATGVTLNTASGQITMNNAALAAGTIVSFVLTDSAIAATDVLVLNHISGGTVGAYTLNAQCAAGSATINVRNNTAGPLSEAVVIQFALVKAVNS